jgi:hypothetical protein
MPGTGGTGKQALPLPLFFDVVRNTLLTQIFKYDKKILDIF